MRAALAALCLTALTAGAAFAADGGKEQIHFNAADQASARRAVTARADLGSGAWTGGLRKPDLSAAQTCANFHPKQSDLVLTGAAESEWNDNVLRLQTEAQILKTPAMVAADWRRTVLARGAIPCMESHLVKELGAGVKFCRVLPPGAVSARCNKRAGIRAALRREDRDPEGSRGDRGRADRAGTDRADDRLDGAERAPEGRCAGRRAARARPRRSLDLRG